MSTTIKIEQNEVNITINKSEDILDTKFTGLSSTRLGFKNLQEAVDHTELTTAIYNEHGNNKYL